tara:strand:- start:80 stop:451 length:372 start_codon:yes stop_codon:yes gene_type:complete
MGFTISGILHTMCPNTEFTIINDDYDTLLWFDTSKTKPTLDEINTKRTELENQLAFDLLRCERNLLLNNTDKYMVSDFPHSSESIKQQWVTYRQSLRDLPSNSDPKLDINMELTNITWPTPPS